MAEAKVFIDVGSNDFGSGNGFDHGCRTGSAVAAGKDAGHIVETAVAFGLDLAAVDRKTGFLKVLELNILPDCYD